jgi:sensor histidine kinase YesM
LQNGGLVSKPMNAGATRIFGENSFFWNARLRGLFAGLGYALLLASVLMVSWSVQDIINEVPTQSVLHSLQNFLGNIRRYAIATLPTVPILILALNLAPRDIFSRAAWLVLPVLLMALWSTLMMYAASPDASMATFLSDRMLTAVLLAAVCLYHSSVRGATDTLVRAQIENATLGTEFEHARLQILRSQIEPHFLFNTLANVRTLAQIDRVAAVEMLDNLMRYLAAALPKLRQADSSLGEEMQLVDAYLSLFRVRMGTRLSFVVALPPELATLRVPTMMLLTLVENALKHGINPAIEGGFIRVSAMRSGSSLVLKVADSGSGISQHQIHGTGTGLANVRSRLTMQYGEAGTLSLARAEPRGVVAAITLPIAFGT